MLYVAFILQTKSPQSFPFSASRVSRIPLLFIVEVQPLSLLGESVCDKEGAQVDGDFKSATFNSWMHAGCSVTPPIKGSHPLRVFIGS